MHLSNLEWLAVGLIIAGILILVFTPSAPRGIEQHEPGWVHDDACKCNACGAAWHSNDGKCHLCRRGRRVLKNWPEQCTCGHDQGAGTRHLGSCPRYDHGEFRR